ncbi:hypothetical protein GU3_14120 [Oceanimonas sp. GK1]|uniref:hypothetical protein n=1 Tax=Oceanimonas sp. (strain GK1 / IBRC-M 10197) TaxID=511062 RepID=UPI0002494E6F|nr:hypothetical protein [Oceanimonas sp. GK1]AEY02577.1 hypothetical protein GU3_14120 [Oceanimonas sp. GK1]
MNNKRHTGPGLAGSTSGKVHPAEEAAFPPYDFFHRETPREQQRERLVPALEACRDGWRRRLEAMLYRSEVGLSCRLQDSAPETGDSLYFAMDHQWDGRWQPSAALHIDHDTLYRLAEMTFGGQPQQGRGPRRPLSETERRLGAGLLTMLAGDVVARILPEAVPGAGRLLPANPDFTTETRIAFQVRLAEQSLDWVLALPRLQPPSSEEAMPAMQAALGQTLNASLPRLCTRLSVPLATFDLPLWRLRELQEGEVLPINLLPEVVARAGEQPVLKGRVAERDGMLVFASHGFID